ncbi:hypothetical protein ACEQPO_08065 [Bacillus sp. SL00103]
MTDENRKNRVYDGLSFTFELAGAVHTAEITGGNHYLKGLNQWHTHIIDGRHHHGGR